MPLLEAFVMILAFGLFWLILPLLIPAALIVALGFFVWHGAPKFSWDANEPAAEPRQ